MTETVPNLSGAALVLDRHGTSRRHVHHGQPVEDRTVLEARWVKNDDEGHAGLFPRWHLVVATIDGQADVDLHDLPPGTTLRWPEL